MKEIREIIRRVLNEEMDVSNFDYISKEEYQSQLDRLGIEKFSDLIGSTVYYTKPTYGEHIVLDWDTKSAEYLLFTEGQKVTSNPFRIIKVLERKELDPEQEIKWIIEKLSSEKDIKSINIKDKTVNDDGVLTILFDVVMGVGESGDIDVVWEDVILELRIKGGTTGMSSYLRNPGSEKIIRSVHSGVGGQWNNNSPFVAPSYHISDYDWGYMSKVVEKIILELI